jgi:CheY-like chemotaxis protein
VSKRKLLLADDSVTIQKVVNLTFADEGIEVISVGDGDSAMEKVAEISPDLIMADVNMPGLTGYEICEKIRQDDNLRRTPVILLVGSFEPFDEDEARRVGADDYLTKPFQSIRQLVNKVTVLLNSQTYQNGDGTTNASSLEDTLEMDADEISSVAQSSQYADAGYDDEMIQTNRPSSFAFDETQKFESREAEESSATAQFESPENYEEDKSLQTVKVADFSMFDEARRSESFSTEPQEIEGIAYESKVEENIAPETESSGYPSETEANIGVSDERAEEENQPNILENEAVYDDAQPNAPEENNVVTDEVQNEEELLGEIQEAETVPSESVSDEIEDEENVLEEAGTNADNLDETKDFALIPDEIEPNDYASDETVLEEIQPEELAETATSESEIVADETILPEVADEPVSAEINQPESEVEEEIIAEDTATEVTAKSSEEDIPLPDSVSVLEFDDDDLLQLPPLELDFEDEEEAVEPEVETIAAVAPIGRAYAVDNAPSKFEPTGNSTAIDSTQISPELIDLIVAKVIERLSENAVKEVAWEVVPQMTELIVTKMAEEKLK